MTWSTDLDRVALARELWDAGLSGTQIGKRVNATKSAVIGLAHRRGWPPRPSPLRPAGSGRPAKQIKAERELRKKLRTKPTQVPVEPEPPPLPQCAGCQFPTSDGRPWRFCEAQTQPLQVYCAEHQRICRSRGELR
jgi:hypothetical protein